MTEGAPYRCEQCMNKRVIRNADDPSEILLTFCGMYNTYVLPDNTWCLAFQPDSKNRTDSKNVDVTRQTKQHTRHELISIEISENTGATG